MNPKELLSKKLRKLKDQLNAEIKAKDQKQQKITYKLIELYENALKRLN